MLLLTFSGALASQAQDGTWQKVSIADSVTVEFPVEPKKYTQSGVTAYNVYHDSVVYSVAIIRNANSEKIADEDKQELYDGLIKGAVKRANATAIDTKTEFAANSYKGVEVSFHSHVKQLQGLTTIRAVLVNGTVFSQTFVGADNAANTSARQRFFKSFMPHQRPAPPVKSRAYRFGEMMGRLLLYGLLLAGILYLVSRPRKKGQPKASA